MMPSLSFADFLCYAAQAGSCGLTRRSHTDCGYGLYAHILCCSAPSTLHVLLRRRVIVKLGPRYDMGDLLPKEQEGWKVAVSGIDFCVWEKASGEA